ncbi:MAG: Chromosomal replication initiator protein DnaA [Candidatus Dichloromethanomonas elyunquensis]|nr:MAG: Chromosomal replication initiator protein DnaA [Candidatus Dichloromethanomonas elyunquensis]
MFISNYNRLAFQFVDRFDFRQAPAVTIISGNEGLGKTALLNYLCQKADGAVHPIVLIDARKFGTNYAFAAQHDGLSAFRKKFRSCKLFLLDNIHILKGKKKTVEELFHTLDAILSQEGKIVITCAGDTPDLDFLGARFASRLHSGLILRIMNPTTEELENFTAYYLASTQVACEFAAMLSQAANMKQAVDFIENRSHSREKTTDPSSLYALGNKEDHVQLVLSFVSGYYGVDQAKIVNGSNSPSNVEARYMVFLLLHEIFDYSYKEIAVFFQRNLYGLKNGCFGIKEREKETFETLYQRLYNQLGINFNIHSANR